MTNEAVRKLRRSKNNRMLAGICGGLAELGVSGTLANIDIQQQNNLLGDIVRRSKPPTTKTPLRVSLLIFGVVDTPFCFSKNRSSCSSKWKATLMAMMK